MAKIIAQTKGGYLVDISSDDMCHLAGYYYSGESGCPRFQAGDTLNISKMYHRLNGLKGSQAQLDRMATTLTDFAKLLTENFAPVVADLTDDKP